jgi:hypothetical protein
MYISRVIFFRFQKWSRDVIRTLSDNNGKVGDIITHNETPDLVYELINLKQVETLTEEEFEKICMGKLCAFVDAENKKRASTVPERDSNPDTNTISNANSPEQEFSGTNLNQPQRHVPPPRNDEIIDVCTQDIKNNFYRSVNKLVKEYNTNTNAWISVLADTTLPEPGHIAMNHITPVVSLFIDTYKLFTENKDILENEITPFTINYYKMYDSFELDAVIRSKRDLQFIHLALTQYNQDIGNPQVKKERILNIRTTDQAARTLPEMLDGNEHWPSRKIAYCMKALNSAMFASTPEPQVLTELQPQMRSQHMEEFGEGRVMYALIGVTNIIPKQNDDDKYEVMKSPANYKAFLWLPEHPKNNNVIKDHTTKSMQLLQSKFKNITAAFSDYITHGDRGPNEDTNVFCSRDALEVIKYFTGKEAGVKVTSAYKVGETALATTVFNTKTRSSSSKKRRGENSC